MIPHKAGPYQNLVCIFVCNGSRVISENVLCCGFINPSYTNLPWSAAPVQDMNYWNPCGQQREQQQNPPEPSRANSQTPCLSSRSLKQVCPSHPRQEVISNCIPWTSWERWGIPAFARAAWYLFLSASSLGFLPDPSCGEAMGTDLDSCSEVYSQAGGSYLFTSGRGRPGLLLPTASRPPPRWGVMLPPFLLLR